MTIRDVYKRQVFIKSDGGRHLDCYLLYCKRSIITYGSGEKLSLIHI